MNSPDPRLRFGLLTLIAAVVVGLVVVAFVTIAPLRQYVSGAPSRPPPDAGYVIAAAGDISCSVDAEVEAEQAEPNDLPTTDEGVPAESRPASSCAQKGTADLIAALRPVSVLPLGDLQYECGSRSDFAGSYAATWGQFNSVSHPVVGNHEYGTACGDNDADAYFEYFGDAATGGDRGWYSYDIGSWHLIALNSECSYGTGAQKVGGCATGTDQERWLRADLAAHKNSCTLAYYHEPRFSSGQHGNAVQMTDIWNDLVAAHVDVVLSAHNHVYERFDPLGAAPAASGAAPTADKPNFEQPNPDPAGIQQFVVGTGGKNHYKFTQPPMMGERIRNDSTFGVLSLTLKSNSYDWEFLPVRGDNFTDSGSASCR